MGLEFVTAAPVHERSADVFETGAAEYGWCLRTGMGVPLDFTLAAGLQILPSSF
jgi:hypothetical protein